MRQGVSTDTLVVDTIRGHADGLLRLARRYSLCADDAEDAYQRALEIFVRRAHRLDADGAPKWLRTVVKHEALAVRRQRLELVGCDEADLDRREAPDAVPVDERAERLDDLLRAAEALQRLKPQELTALWLRGQGLTYKEIAERQSWTYTKVNRCITEGRRSFLERFAGIDSGEECRRWEPLLSAMVDGEAGADDLAAVRPHLRRCPACRRTLGELRSSAGPLAVLLPVGGAPLGEGADVAGHLLPRLVESLSGLVHERVASSAVKVQMAVEAAGGGKVAAVAASAAAVAGGGVAVERTVEREARADRPAAERPAPTRAPGGAPAPGVVLAAAAPRVGAEPGAAPSAATPAVPPPRRRTATATARREFRTTASSPSTATAEQEFAAPGTASTATASGGAGGWSQPEPAPSAPTGSTSGSGSTSSAGQEFGFEGG